ncbi:hypothetical protein V8E53_003119 [Lactarius tabidus]
MLSKTYGMPENVAKALVHISEVAQQIDSQCQGCANALAIPGLIKEMQGHFSKELEQRMCALESKISASPSSDSDHLESVTKEIGQAAQSIKAVARKMGKTIAQVTDTSSHLASTATNYKDALLRSNTQQPQPQPQTPPEKPSQSDLKVLRHVGRKARQILIDTRDDKLLNASLAEIKEKVNAAINTITNPPPPKEATILEISKLRKGGFMVLFKEKEAVKWLQDPSIESNFTSVFAEDATITKHTYPIMVPRILLTFDPSEEGHLREVEECNKLPTGTIVKARWIKPAYRRAPEQRSAHAIFSLKEITIANICIRDGLYVCGL